MWEWRAFAENFAGLDDTFEGAEEESRRDVYLLAEGLSADWNLKLRDGQTFEAKHREASEDGCERWTKLLSHPLVVPPQEVRELARQLTPIGKVPVRPVRDLAGALRLLSDVGLGAARAVTVEKRLRRVVGPAGLLEHGQLTVAGESWETLALEAGDLESLRNLRDALGVSGEAQVCSYAAFLVEGCA